MSSQRSSSRTQSQRYNVYRVRYTLALQDPDVPGPRYHNVIFVETEADGSGMIHHVTGDLVYGMTYQSKRARRPEASASFYNKDFLGTVLAADYPGNVNAILQAQPPPGRQKAFNIKTGKTEPVKPDGTFYAANERRPPLIKCTEWTEQRAVPALQQSGIFEAARAASNPSSRHSSQGPARQAQEGSSRTITGHGTSSSGTASR